jgi:hypothetical protein
LGTGEFAGQFPSKKPEQQKIQRPAGPKEGPQGIGGEGCFGAVVSPDLLVESTRF